MNFVVVIVRVKNERMKDSREILDFSKGISKRESINGKGKDVGEMLRERKKRGE